MYDIWIKKSVIEQRASGPKEHCCLQSALWKVTWSLLGRKETGDKYQPSGAPRVIGYDHSVAKSGQTLLALLGLLWVLERQPSSGNTDEGSVNSSPSLLQKIEHYMLTTYKWGARPPPPQTHPRRSVSVTSIDYSFVVACFSLSVHSVRQFWSVDTHKRIENRSIIQINQTRNF